MKNHELRSGAAAVQNQKRRAAQPRSARQTQFPAALGRRAGPAVCADEKGQGRARKEFSPSAAAASSTARFTSTKKRRTRWPTLTPKNRWSKISKACSRAKPRPSGWIPRPPRNAPKSARNWAASSSPPRAPARTPSSASPARKSANFTRPNPRPTKRPRTSRWSVHSWPRCSRAKSRRLISATAPA